MNDYSQLLQLLPVVGLGFAFGMVHNSILRWKSLLGYRYTVCEHVRSIVHDCAVQTDRDTLLSYIAMYVYYNDLLDGSEGLKGTRPFLVGLWSWIVSPLCLLFIPVYVVFLISDISSGRAYVIAFLILWTVIVLLFRFFFDRLDKMQSIIPVPPQTGIKNIMRVI